MGRAGRGAWHKPLPLVLLQCSSAQGTAPRALEKGEGEVRAFKAASGNDVHIQHFTVTFPQEQ